VEIDWNFDVWEIPALDCLYVFSEPVSFAFKNGKPAKNKCFGLGVKAGFIKIQDMQWKVADDDF